MTSQSHDEVLHKINELLTATPPKLVRVNPDELKRVAFDESASYVGAFEEYAFYVGAWDLNNHIIGLIGSDVGVVMGNMARHESPGTESLSLVGVPSVDETGLAARFVASWGQNWAAHSWVFAPHLHPFAVILIPKGDHGEEFWQAIELIKERLQRAAPKRAVAVEEYEGGNSALLVDGREARLAIWLNNRKL